jgi:hypothetical protein
MVDKESEAKSSIPFATGQARQSESPQQQPTEPTADDMADSIQKREEPPPKAPTKP